MGIHYTYGANKNAKLMEKKAKREKKLAEKRAKKQVKTGPVKIEEDKTIPLDQEESFCLLQFLLGQFSPVFLLFFLQAFFLF